MEHKKIVITGASRGIGREIALKMAAQGAHVALLAKSVDDHPKLPGTILSVAKEVIDLGGHAYPMQLDVRNEEDVVRVIDRVAEMMNGIDIVINNASAISLTDTPNTNIKRYDLMFDINVRGTFVVTQAALPYLKKSDHARILTLSPPLDLKPHWFGNHVAYTISKYNMSLLTLGWAEEFKSDGIAANALWPQTLIATSAIEYLPGGEHLLPLSRKPAIVADAVDTILKKSVETTGQFFIDEAVLRASGVVDFSKYNHSDQKPMNDLFISEDIN